MLWRFCSRTEAVAADVAVGLERTGGSLPHASLGPAPSPQPAAPRVLREGPWQGGCGLRPARPGQPCDAAPSWGPGSEGPQAGGAHWAATHVLAI